MFHTQESVTFPYLTWAAFAHVKIWYVPYIGSKCSQMVDSFLHLQFTDWTCVYSHTVVVIIKCVAYRWLICRRKIKVGNIHDNE